MHLHWTMHRKIFAAVMMLNILIISVVSIFFQQKASTFFTQEYLHSLSERNILLGQNVDEIYQSVYQTTLDAANATELRQLLLSPDSSPHAIASELRHYQSRNAFIDNVYCYLPATKELIQAGEFNESRQLSDNTAQEWQNILDRQNGMRPLFTSDLLSASQKNIYLYHQDIFDEHGNCIAQLAFTISASSLWYNKLTIANEKSADIFLFDDQGNLTAGSKTLTTDESQQLQDFSAKEKATFSLRNSTYTVVSDKLPFSGYTLYLLSNQRPFQQQLFTLIGFTILTALICLLASTLLLWWISHIISQPVEKLTQTMQAVADGNLKKRAIEDDNDEIGVLAKTFNHMLNRMDTLINRLANERALKKEAELNALQYQIRPHFVYNTLQSIRFAAMMQGAKNIGQLLADFIEILRASTNRNGAFAPLTAELHTLKSYISLQQFRMMDVFDVTFDIAEDTKACIVPRLILQPLVENSIIHGPSEEREFCQITVTSYVKGNSLYLIVADDGQGMTQEQCQNLLAPTPNSHGGLSGIGIKNIVERLHLYYGDKASLTYESDDSTFTRAIIRLPVSHDTTEYAIK